MEPIIGTPNNDTLTGTDGNDEIRGLGGDDLLLGLGGDDLLLGGSGNDTLMGGPGRDTLRGEGGDDSLTGLPGDLLFGGGGNDTIHLPFAPEGDPVEAHGDTGDDVFRVETVWGGRLFGGGGTDRLIFAPASPMPVAVDFREPLGSFRGGTGPVGEATGFERLEVSAGAGDDTVFGSDGDDVLIVREGANRVEAGAGNDRVGVVIDGWPDTLDGGPGQDTLEASVAPGGVLYFIIDAEGQVADGMLSSITGFEHYDVTGGRRNDIAAFFTGNDTFKGGGGEDTAFGGGGRDILAGGAGDDRLFGGAGRDRLTGGDGNDRLAGGAGHDRLAGGAGDDTLNGGDGDDMLNGGDGDDWLTGGAGADTFVIGDGGIGINRITDFTPGEDRIAVEGVIFGGLLGPGGIDRDDLVHGAPGDSRPVFVLDTDGPDGPSRLFWDADGAGSQAARLLFVIDGPPNLTAEDIVIL
jgi:Ca2+-binding RTX toxin-like protein